MQIITKPIITKEGESEFQLRLIKEEGVGLLTTTTDKNYLILDSLDYWYDLIQKKYPRKTKCKCRNEWFNIHFDYIPRKGVADIRQVNVITNCTSCFNEKKQLSIDINYAPTKHLLNEPLIFCANPQIIYNLTEVNCYWSQADLKKLLAFLSTGLGLDIYCWFWQHSDNKRHFEKVSLEKAYEIITVNHKYLNFYFSRDTPSFKTNNHDSGIYVEDEPWRKQTLIQLSSPSVIAFGEGQKGLLYYLHFSTQFVDNGIVVDKPEAFKSITDKTLNWLHQHYVEIRGRDCFDNMDEHRRIFGDKYLKKKAGN